MRPDYQNDIRRLALFSNLDEPSFERLMRGAYMQNFPPQIDLIHEGDSADFLHIVVDGAVELFAGWNGRETTMALVRPISTFILAATIRDAPYLMSARTVMPARILLVPSVDVRAVFDDDSTFARAVVGELASCYRNVVRHTKDLKLRSSIERLANYLIRQTAAQGDAQSFALPTEKRRIASSLGMTPENLSRAFKTLAAHGVEIDGQTVHIRDAAALHDLAKPTPLIDDPRN